MWGGGVAVGSTKEFCRRRREVGERSPGLLSSVKLPVLRDFRGGGDWLEQLLLLLLLLLLPPPQLLLLLPVRLAVFFALLLFGVLGERGGVWHAGGEFVGLAAPSRPLLFLGLLGRGLFGFLSLRDDTQVWVVTVPSNSNCLSSGPPASMISLERVVGLSLIVT